MFTKLLVFVKPYNITFYGVMTSAILISLLSTLTPYLLKVVVDDYLLLKNYDGMQSIILIMIIVLFLEVVFMYLFTYYANWLGQMVIKNLRVKVFEKILKFKMSFFDKNAVGRLVTRTVNDIETIASIFSQGLFMIIADILKMVTVLTVMTIINLELTLVVISIFPILIYATRVFQKSMKVAFERVRREVANLNSFVQERISGVKIVQIFNREQLEIKNFNDINTKHRDAWLRTVWINSIFFPIAEISTSICIGLLVWWGGFNNLNGENISLGTLFLFISMSGLLFRPLRQIADRFNTLQMGMVSSERIFKILEDDSEINDNGIIEQSSFNGLIEFKNVKFSYIENQLVINDISFKIYPGETTAIVGPTGSGKTTITNLITKFYEIDSGSILIDGRDINEFKLENIRKKIGVILQDVFLFADTIFNNITLFNNEISIKDVERAAKDLEIHDFILSLPGGYDFNVSERGSTLSSGQKQLIAFLRVLVNNPDILILDEATSSIDSYSEDLIKNATKKITMGKTSIIIAHRLSTVESADKIIYMENGRILEYGNHRELLNIPNGKFKKLYEEQFVENELV
ncbi:MAG: ABC transporter ATP-binding protein [Cryomorphaceae bacterium]|nr:ABC transporter ATP-binding protein [Cryomorphaceae bacterium]MBT3688815.1 ABC transporter ATP-binding protein [Cryomorphaceae bacterium]MBT4221947.1 ABC transporter ATP-binding protein [Cryomorphaceae bacterium]MBT4834148.1 ABC transporter ATP-binding protein [Cryomorphaceae bacterium]MBT5936861.1 ABC transporter ATP-binding protein [Cryomorphaceae bacterium]